MNVMKSVIASVLDEKGNQVYPRQWNNKYMDTPIVGDDLNTPTLTREEVDEIIHATEGRKADAVYPARGHWNPDRGNDGSERGAYR
jgi:hypothetical protein